MTLPEDRAHVQDYRIATSVLEAMVRGCISERDRVRVHQGRRGIEVNVDDGRCRITLPLDARFGEDLPALAAEVRNEVSRCMAAMTGLEVETVDVVLTGVFPVADVE